MKPLAIDLIKTDLGTQMREKLDEQTVQEYQDLLASSKKWPFDKPLVVFELGKNEYALADGFHRMEASRLAKRGSVQCEVKKGSLDEAIDYALQANQTHGKRRTNADKRRCVTTALGLERWRTRSDRAIADHVGVSQPFVGMVRKSLSGDNGYHLPEKTTGKDGKSYPLKTPKPTPAATRNPVDAAQDVGKAPGGGVSRRSEQGKSVPTAAKLAEEAIRMVSPLVRKVDEVSKAAGGPGRNYKKASEALDTILLALKEMRGGNR